MIDRRVKSVRGSRLLVQGLESRVLMAADHGLDHDDHDRGLEITPVLVTPQALKAATTVVGSTGGISAATVPVSTVPAYNSRPGAYAQIYLDFNGDTMSTWGTYRPGT